MYMLSICARSMYIAINDIISYHIISYHIISYHIISYHIISYHIISYHIISYHIISRHIISYLVISYPIICKTGRPERGLTQKVHVLLIHELCFQAYQGERAGLRPWRPPGQTPQGGRARPGLLRGDDLDHCLHVPGSLADNFLLS